MTRRLPDRPGHRRHRLLVGIIKESGSRRDEAAFHGQLGLFRAFPGAVADVIGITMTVATKILVAKSGPRASNWNN
jgi:hypothetical protein